MSAVPPPPGPGDAIVTPGVDNPMPAETPPTPKLDAGARVGGPQGSPEPSVESVGSAPTPTPASQSVPSSAAIRPAIIATSVVVTVVHIIMTLLGLANDADAVRNGVASVSVALFFLGAVSFIVAFVLAAGRSRYEDLWFGGAFFLTGGVVPARARTLLMGCLAVQSVVGLLGASLAPFTPVAFVVLVPLAAMGLMSLYGARWGEFSPKVESD